MMFGFSFPKLAVLIAIILVVWYGFKFLGQRRELSEAAIKSGKIKQKSRLPEILWIIASIGFIAVAIIWGLKQFL